MRRGACVLLLVFVAACGGSDAAPPDAASDAYVDLCVPDPCSGHGTCTVGSSGAECACNGHFDGVSCATCAVGYDGADCSACATGYFEQPPGSGTCVDDPCSPDPCSGHGSCSNASGSAACTCTTGYAGASCAACDAGNYEYPAGSGLCLDDPCLPDPCNGHGTCSNASGAAVCTCSSHFSGPACAACDAGYAGAGCASCDAGYYEYPASSGTCVDDPCAPDPCNGHGSCANTSGAAVCTCSGHYNGATCSGCAPAYAGTTCTACGSGYYELPASSGTCVDDPCAPDPCNGHGSCTNSTGSAVCGCSAAYTGATCTSCASGYFEFPASSGTCVDDPCLPDPCSGHGTCSNASGAGACACTGHYAGPGCASCATGYTGATCASCAAGYFEFPSGSGTCVDDPCLPDPCNGHGTCSNASGAGMCSCTGNFTGASCNTCVTGYTGATCSSCAAGYYEFPSGSGICVDNPCLPDPCNGHGTCANASGAAVCTCSNGYAGTTCTSCDTGFYEYPIGFGTCIDDPCDPDPCSGHGTCSNTSGAAACSCLGHYTGASCNTCTAPYTGGTCTTCAAGYYEYPASSGTCVDDPCLPDPCNGHGTCSNASGAAACTCTGNFTGAACSTCVNGYSGADCQTNIDDCSPNPCKNAGTCADGVASYTCTCKGAWDGPTCTDIYYGASANQNNALRADTIASCKEESFLDLTDWLPDPNTAYADPTLTITCSASTMSVTSNDVPQYLIDWASPSRNSFANTLVPTSQSFSIPRNPVFNATVTQATVVGGVGVAVNGVHVSSPSASGGQLEYADPASIEVDGDTCEGHPNPSGAYHYHALRTSCFFPDADDGDLRGDPCTAPSPIIAWMADGYPMYGPCECLDAACTQVVEMRSSYALSGGDNNPAACAYQDYTYVGNAGEESDGDKYLDECSGHYGPNGDYHYHATNEYPWTLRCYRGTPTTTMAAGHTYNAGAGGADCCFTKQCINGVYQSGVSCMTASCTP